MCLRDRQIINGNSIDVCQRDKVAMIDFLKILFFITSKSLSLIHIFTDITATTAEAEDYTGEDGLLYLSLIHIFQTGVDVPVTPMMLYGLISMALGAVFMFAEIIHRRDQKGGEDVYKRQP